MAAALLVAGTSIGGGMLALPVSTGAAGFVPSFVLMFLCWGFMTLTGLLLLEANLWMKEGAHIITISASLLGPVGKAVSWVIFLFISYASLVAYIAGGGSMMQEAVNMATGMNMPQWIACLIFIALFGIVIDLGAKIVGRVNAMLVGAMVIAYAALVTFGIPEINADFLTHKDWTKTLIAAPIVLTIFSFQCIVPSLTIYLKRNAKALRIAIVSGTTITLIVYLIWEFLVLGTVPRNGVDSLAQALEQGEAATDFYRQAVGNPWVSGIAAFFAFFALATSFLGLGLGLFDFLSDGLKIKKKGMGKFILGTLIIVPSLTFALVYERAFLVALDTSGGFGDTILNGIMPALMVWMGRYYYKHKGQFSIPGGRPLLVTVIVFYLCVFSLQLYASVR